MCLTISLTPRRHMVMGLTPLFRIYTVIIVKFCTIFINNKNDIVLTLLSITGQILNSISPIHRQNRNLEVNLRSPLALASSTDRQRPGRKSRTPGVLNTNTLSDVS
jgi:3-isopropylmalate dehydratase small subunit